MARILVVEDDMTLCQELKTSLQKWSHEVLTVECFEQVLNVFVEQEPELVIMDITLPVFDGFYWCHKIRERSNVPILFLSSHEKEEEMIMAMTLGGDDFMTKPFKISLLIAKINAMLRRTYDYKIDTGDRLNYQNMVLDLSSSQVQIDETFIELTKNECRLLSMLMKHSEEILSRDAIMDYLWDNNQFINDNTLTVNMNRLRQKLTEAGGECYIQTKKGQGYMLKRNE